MGPSEGRGSIAVWRMMALTESRLGRSATIVAARGHLGVSVWLTAFAVLTVLSSAAVCADNSYNLHFRTLGEYLAGGTLEVSVLGIKLREDRRELQSGAFATGLLIRQRKGWKSRRERRVGRFPTKAEEEVFGYRRRRRSDNRR